MAESYTESVGNGAGISLSDAVSRHLANRTTEAPADEAAAEDVTGETTETETLAQDAQAVEVSPEDEGERPETEDTEGQQEGEDESPGWESFDELAEAAGMDLDAFMTNVKTTIDGESISARQLIQGYREGKATQEDRTRLSEERAAFQAEREQAVARFAEADASAAALGEVILGLAQREKEAVQQQMASLDWTALAQTPGAHADASMRFQQALHAIDTQAQAALQQVQAGAAKIQEHSAAVRAAYVEKGIEGFRAAFASEITDDGGLTAARSKVDEYVRATWPDTTDKELEGVWSDARIATAMEKARRYDDLMARSADVTKGRTVRPLRRGAPSTNLGGDTTKARVVKAAKDAFREQVQQGGSPLDQIEAAVAYKRSQRR